VFLEKEDFPCPERAAQGSLHSKSALRVFRRIASLASLCYFRLLQLFPSGIGKIIKSFCANANGIGRVIFFIAFFL